jgi:hypothetical protein
MLADPLLVRVKVCDCCDPMVTLPNASLLGLDPKSPWGAVVPVPESESATGPFVASLETVAVALNVPAALGLKLTTTGTLCPDATVMGMLGETREKYLLEIETPLTLTDDGPELDAENVRVLVVPACTLPNCNIAVLRESVVVCCC